MTRNTATLRNLIRCNRILSSSVTETLISSPNPTVSYSNSLFSSKKPFFTATTTAAAAKFQLPQHISIHRCLSSPPSGPSNIVVIDSEEKFSSSFRKVQDETLPAIVYFTAVWCGPCRLLSPIIGQLSEKYPHVTIYKIDIDQEELGSKLSELNIHSVVKQLLSQPPPETLLASAAATTTTSSSHPALPGSPKPLPTSGRHTPASSPLPPPSPLTPAIPLHLQLPHPSLLHLAASLTTHPHLHVSASPALHFYKDGKKAAEVIGADVQRLKDAMENLYK
ncbi:hypothetical protein TEA_016364 [Camellia sinensis var. sinensis]|uniref:Thioredoxin domain-containing protein n=1 Tax=Camellia sinensis var. sinensis TaxID=542762 RepID=A0A4S4DAC8_CAMSN|nr:hypothetical protein TEA_016364 [Camellia sinensis var. sinensis]